MDRSRHDNFRLEVGRYAEFSLVLTTLRTSLSSPGFTVLRQEISSTYNRPMALEQLHHHNVIKVT